MPGGITCSPTPSATPALAPTQRPLAHPASTIATASSCCESNRNVVQVAQLEPRAGSGFHCSRIPGCSVCHGGRFGVSIDSPEVLLWCFGVSHSPPLIGGLVWDELDRKGSRLRVLFVPLVGFVP